jgi:hypothetical protein
MQPTHFTELIDLRLRHPDGTVTSHPQAWARGQIAVDCEIEVALGEDDDEIVRAKLLNVYRAPPKMGGGHVEVVPDVFAELVPPTT